jgi:RAQPRD family integrative conjugative element protein
MQFKMLLLLSLLIWQDVVADDTVKDEYQALLKIDRHLSDLALLIDEAELSADPDSRIRFRYDWLRRDIARVRNGVQAHIHRPLAEKQANAALQGDYQR